MNLGKRNLIYLEGDFTNFKLFMFPQIQHVCKVKKQVLTKLRCVSKVKDFRSMLNMFRVGLSVCV